MKKFKFRFTFWDDLGKVSEYVKLVEYGVDEDEPTTEQLEEAIKDWVLAHTDYRIEYLE